MKFKKELIVFSIIIFIILNMTLITKYNQTPYQFLQNKLIASSSTSPSEFLYQSKIDDKQYIIFYINENNNMSCAILKRNWINYSILDVSGEMSLFDDTKKTNHLFSSYKNAQNREWIDWGIIYDNNIKKVMINEKDINIIDLSLYKLRIYYLLGNETEKTIPPEYILIE